MTITLRRSTVESYLTYEDIWTKVQALIDDDDADVLVVIKTVINLVYQEIISKFKDSQNPPQWMLDYDTALSMTASTRETSLTTPDKDVERIMKVSVLQGSAWYPCYPITMTEVEESPNQWWDTNKEERPIRFFHKKTYNTTGGEDNSILWFPLPDDDYSFRYWFDIRFPELTLAEDVPKLPPFSHPALVYGTLTQLSMFDIRIKVGPWAELYTMMMNRLNSFSNSFVGNITQGVRPWGL